MDRGLTLPQTDKAASVSAIRPQGIQLTLERYTFPQSRNLMEQLRSATMKTGGLPSFNDRNKQAFANQLVKRKRQSPKNGL